MVLNKREKLLLHFVHGNSSSLGLGPEGLPRPDGGLDGGRVCDLPAFDLTEFW